VVMQVNTMEEGEQNRRFRRSPPSPECCSS
jgi:hypothetical protein